MELFIYTSIYSILASSNLCNTHSVQDIFLDHSFSLLCVLWNPLFKVRNELLEMPPEVACPGMLCTKQPYLSSNQKCTRAIHSLDNLVSPFCGNSVVLSCKSEISCFSVLVGDLQFLMEVEVLTAFSSVSTGKQEFSLDYLVAVDN